MWPYTNEENEALATPRGSLAARTLAMPANTNPAGDIFGGWIMSMMDAAGAITATERADGRVVTAGVTQLSFAAPVKVGDVVCCYTEITAVRRTSLELHVEVWILREGRGLRRKVTSADFTFVALDGEGLPRPVDQPPPRRSKAA